MRAIVQRVTRAAVSWREEEPAREEVRRIGAGLVVLVGAGPGDAESEADRLADKIARLRIFPDERDRVNLSLEETGGEALVVSQFTLYADTSRGRRPGFTGAGDPERAERLCRRFTERLAGRGVPTQSGSFGARMTVSLENEGPFTLALSTEPWETRIGG